MSTVRSTIFKINFSPEYMKLINSGFESPSFTTKVMENHPIKIESPHVINQLWQPQDPRQNDLWQNVEYVISFFKIFRIDIITDLQIFPDIIHLLILL